jgi:3-oxoacyl-[acyl-carrier-protein] synthase II
MGPDGRPAAVARPGAGASAHRVVVTGAGSVSALAVGGGAAVRAALRRGIPALGPVRAFSTGMARSRLGGEVGAFDTHLLSDEARRLSRVSQFAVVAARLALRDAGLEPGAVPGLGLVIGSHWGDFRSSEAFAQGFLTRGPLGLSPLVFPSTVMNAMAAHVAIAVGARGPMLTLSQATIAGDLAVARGTSLIATGRADVVLAGGVDELCPILYHEVSRLGLLSSCQPGPEGCRPFDRRADGSVLGEGATLVVLESARHAERRGARPHAEVAAAVWGNLPAPAHGFPPPARRDPRVVRDALARAGLVAEAVEAACLTGAGHPGQDACELDLIAGAFARPGAPRPRLTAITPLAGEHGGLGALRVWAAACAIAGDGVPALPDLREPVRQDLVFVQPGPAPAHRPRVVLVHGLARGGTQAALVLRCPEAAA